MSETGTAVAPERRLVLWDLYFAVSYLVTVVLVLRTAAVVPLTAAAVWYVVVGRPLLSVQNRRSWVFAGVLFGLFAVAVPLAPAGGFALFAVVPMLLMSLSPVPALVLATLGNLLPPLAVWWHFGAGREVLDLLPITALGIAVSTLMGLWITRVVRQNHERAELIDELRRNREEAARLSREAGVAAERERLAREIHDTLAQSLTSVISLIDAAESEEPRADRSRLLALARTAARDGLAEARHFVAALTPPALHGGSLADAVRRLTTTCGVPAVCDVEGVEVPLPMATRVVLLRVAQEAMSNARKHAGATRVEVVLVFGDGDVELAVVDDGRGFDAALPRAGFGLAGMRARVEEVGGALTVTSAPGEGTMITANVPAGGPR
ncbi:sensor histidine kinase [Saccharothrix variisporea]|uniref:Oxygen sensor histidine kinase NreB n=1 Tax=Saccharothrix variisporea TaxID=543527 RepID=A0A495X4A9_9PSEU|nr:sensor histidine kinase [Saccharothrix variisporea]RKT68075.1 signal transduction histidine kinase [Saccharothrix variisporea]